MNEKLCWIIAECTLLVMVVISIGCSEIVYWIRYPDLREHQARFESAKRQQKQTREKPLREADKRQDYENESEMRLNELMGTQPTHVAPIIKSAAKDTDFDSIIASEITTTPPNRQKGP